MDLDAPVLLFNSKNIEHREEQVAYVTAKKFKSLLKS